MQVSLRILSFFSITLALFVVGTGQVKQESFKAFSKLADRIESYTKDDTKKSFRIASVTVESKTDSTAVLQLSIGGSSELKRFEFITVEAESAILANGTFQSVSKPNRIQAAAVTRTDLASDQAFYTPSMVIKTSREANYVMAVFLELEGTRTLHLRIYYH
jgi:hypothetical protein